MEDQKVDFALVYAGKKSGGEAVFEKIPATRIAKNVYKLTSSPGLALNLAKGDLIKIYEGERSAKVLKRGGLFCVHIYEEYIDEKIIERLEKGVKDELRGSLDGVCGGALSFSIPAIVGMEKINKFFNQFKSETGIDWYYTNIYKNLDDLTDDTLLDWWKNLDKSYLYITKS
ncbi:MAG: DUF4265 domain-containing protein [Helicobacteraceae bacterium]|jgi:hypothetical protein|nr:DUF4265 domain-containing protein [Helicobacteraceae bacterium]